MSNISGQREAERVIVYIDGFNLYYGLRSRGWRRYLWLDLHRLSENLLRPAQRLEAVRYFTARISAESHDPDRPRRQGMYLEALETLSDLSLHYGAYITKEHRCPTCGATTRTFEEKMTDVNIAVEMLSDAQGQRFRYGYSHLCRRRFDRSQSTQFAVAIRESESSSLFRLPEIRSPCATPQTDTST